MTSERSGNPPVIVALDYADQKAVMALVDRLSPDRCRLKVGFELFGALGPSIVEALLARDFDVFLDLKFHDIPNTVAHACRVGADMGVWMLNVHALGGRDMMLAAREAVEASSNNPLLIAVTVLTSHSAADLPDVGIEAHPDDMVRRLASLAMGAGLDGVVCSPREAAMLRQAHDDAVLVTPGIRPDGSAKGDQSRTMTPSEAMSAGSNYLVVGRPITQALDPAAALDYINSSLESS